MLEELYTAKKKAIIYCDSKHDCDRIFKIAKVFVHESSDMNVQFSDDVSISTYSPIDYNYCGMTVVRKPMEGEKEKISPTIFCKTFTHEVSRKEIVLYQLFQKEVSLNGTSK